MKGRLLFLGTGASMGVPVIGCNCAVCQSTSVFNKRLRPSVLIQVNSKQLLIDAGPDLRYQALHYQIHHLDGLLLTHAHHDHTAGLDDVRAFYLKSRSSLPILLSHETAEELKLRYHYMFTKQEEEMLLPKIHLHILPEREGEIAFQDVLIDYMTYKQGKMLVNGFRFGTLAYLSDIRHFSETIFEHLKGVKILVVSALRQSSSFMHFSVSEAVDFAKKIGVESAWLTHISHDLDHHETNATLPSNVQLAYDGLEIDFG
jgi:phosphoribosyl 1,2-cyclic phosphate phosphodiesterase